MPSGRMQYSFLYVHAYQLALFSPTLCDSPVLTLEDAHSHDPILRTPLPPVRMQVSLDIDGVALVNPSTMLFRYEREPIISGMQPAHGPPAGGTQISLYGTFPGYFQSSEVMCSFQSMNTNGTEANQRPALTFAMWLSATRMSCVAPATCCRVCQDLFGQQWPELQHEHGSLRVHAASHRASHRPIVRSGGWIDPNRVW